jgi:hypothetical protein
VWSRACFTRRMPRISALMICTLLLLAVTPGCRRVLAMSRADDTKTEFTKADCAMWSDHYVDIMINVASACVKKTGRGPDPETKAHGVALMREGGEDMKRGCGKMLGNTPFDPAEADCLMKSKTGTDLVACDFKGEFFKVMGDGAKKMRASVATQCQNPFDDE